MREMGDNERDGGQDGDRGGGTQFSPRSGRTRTMSTHNQQTNHESIGLSPRAAWRKHAFKMGNSYCFSEKQFPMGLLKGLDAEL